MDAPIRVFLVEDSPIALTILQRILTRGPDIAVVGTAAHGVEAIERIPAANPQVICTDLHMPKMGGLALTRWIMTEYPRPILVISASVQEDDSENIFQLLDAGAIDIFPKPSAGLSSEYEKVQQDLIYRIKVLAGVSVFSQRYRSNPIPHSTSHSTPLSSEPISTSARTTSAQSTTVNAASISSSQANFSQTSFSQTSFSQANSIANVTDIRRPKILAIGSSTGGPQALNTILAQLPADFPIPILCVQHISHGFLSGLITWLSHACKLKICIAQEHRPPQVGTVYFPPEGHHLEVNNFGYLNLSQHPPINGHRPSATVLFKTVAEHYRRAAIGILLTGMGQDGALGMQAIAQSGGMTIAQNEATSVIFGMPKAAIELGVVHHVLPLQKIAPFVLEKVMTKSLGNIE